MADDRPAARWVLMLGQLAGEPNPELPAVKGRRYTAPPERADELAAEWERQHRRTSGASSAWTWATSKAHEVRR